VIGPVKVVQRLTTKLVASLITPAPLVVRWTDIISFDTVTRTAQVALGGDFDHPVRMFVANPDYLPKPGEAMAMAIQQGGDYFLMGGINASRLSDLAHECRTQFWTSSDPVTTHNYSTSYQFVGGSIQLAFTKLLDETRLFAHFSGSYRNTGTSTLIQHALYLDDTDDSVGRWEICRQFTQLNDPNHARADGSRVLGTYGTYAAGDHSLSVAGTSDVATTILTDNDSWTLEVQESW
jgi:hypothetical protein